MKLKDEPKKSINQIQHQKTSNISNADVDFFVIVGYFNDKECIVINIHLFCFFRV